VHKIKLILKQPTTFPTCFISFLPTSSHYSWGIGAFIMIAIFAIVILGLVGSVMLMMNSDKKKKNDQ
jgi:hypothetical protein